MPQIVELPDGIEVEFPDDMSAEQIDFEVTRSFPQFNAKPLDRVPEPGGGLPQLTGGVQSSMPQAFPATESRAQANIAAATPELTGAEVGQMLTTTHGDVHIPDVAKYASIGAQLPQTREFVKPIADAGAAVIEQSLFTPAAPLLDLAGMIPGAREALGASIAYTATKEAAQKAGEFSVTKDPRTAGEATASALMGLGTGVVTGLSIARTQPGVFARELVKENVRPSAAPAAAQAAKATAQVLAKPPIIERTTAISEKKSPNVTAKGEENAIPQREAAPVPVEEPARPSEEVGAQVREQAAAVEAPKEEVAIADRAFGGVAKAELQAAADTFVKMAVSGKIDKLNRQAAGKPQWAEMGADERFSEFRDYAIEDFKELVSLPESERLPYMESRALDPLDPMQQVYQILLKKEGYEFRGNSLRAPSAASNPKIEGTGGAVPSPFSPEALATLASKTVGLVPPASGTPAGVVFNIKSALQKWFRTRGHLPEEVFDLAQELEGARSSANLQVKYANRDLMNALAETYGISKLEMAGGGSKRIPPAAIQLMDDYLHGRVANGAQIPPNIRGVLDTMRAEIEGGSQKVLATLQNQLAQQKPGSARHTQLTELINTIRGNMDVYVHRSYKFFDSKSSAPQWYADLPDPIKQAAESYVANNSPVPLTQAEAQSHILDWLSDLKQTDSFGSSKLGSKDNSIFMRRKMVPPELRAVLGEYRNPIINYAKSVTKMADWVAKQKFLDDVKARGMGTFLFEEGMNPPGFNTQIAADSSRTMSPLNGLRTSEEIAAAFKEFDAHPAPDGIWRGYLMVNAWTKAASTVLSAMTQVRNLSSRPLMAGMAGHWRLGELGRSIKSVATDFAGTDKTWQAYMRRASELGVVGDTARSGELRAIIKDAALQDVAPADLYSWSLWRFIKKFGYDLPADVYRISDELGNIYGFENEKAIQAKINPHLTPAEIETRAARIVRDIYPTYSLTPSAVKGFRKLAVVGPFVTFPYQAIRSAVNALTLSLHEIKSANPVERMVGTKRLASQLGTISATYALEEAGRAYWGVSKQQEEDFRRFQPEWSHNSRFLFTGKDPQKGTMEAVNLSYTDPYAYITDPMIALIRGAASNEDPTEVAIEVAKEAARPWVSEQMLARAIIEARNGVTDSGREIYNPTDSSVEKGMKMVKHIMMTLEPGTLQRFQKRILPAIRNEQPLYGRKLEVGPEIFREATGLSIEKFSFKDGLAFRASAFTDTDRAAEKVFHQTLSRSQTTTPEDLVNAYKESDARRFQAWQEMRKDFLAAIRQGVTVDEARRVMVARGVSRKDAGLIALGRYEPMSISDQAQKRAKERDRKIPIEEIRKVREANRKPLD